MYNRLHPENQICQGKTFHCTCHHKVGNVRWLNRHAQPLSADEWQHGPMQMQILLSDRFLIAINAALDAAEIVLPEGEWRAVPPFAGVDNPVITAVWPGPAHGLCVFQR